MVAYAKMRESELTYSEYSKDKPTEAHLDSPAKQNDKGEEPEADLTASEGAMGIETDPGAAFISSEEAEDGSEEETAEADYDVNIASVYLKEMNRVPLLTRKKEIEVAKRIRQSEQRIRELILQSPLSSMEIDLLRTKSKRERIETTSSEDIVPKIVRRLLKLAQSAGEDSASVRGLVEEFRKAESELKSAKAEMIQANLRLVVSIAKIYLNRGLTFLDLIQEGNMGLMKAVTRYDHRKGFKFSTYASWWIRQAITRALADKSRTIRIPNHLLETRSKIVKAFHELVKDLSRDPLPEEIAHTARIPVTSVVKVMSLIQEPVSLETPVGEDGSKLQDLVGSEESQTFNDELIENMDIARKTRDLLSLLGPREEQILRLRFGIGMPSGYTLEEIGKRFGISRERVRQIEERALKRLRHPVQPEPETAETV
jgi:RNA polymerase primary sigma factor